MKFSPGRASFLLGLAMAIATPALSSSISFTCDGSIGADFDPGNSGTAVCNYLNNQVAALYTSTFTNVNASVYIRATDQGLGDSTSGYYNIVSYATYQAALQNESTDAAKAFVPAPEPSIFSGANVSLTNSLALALGLTNASHSTNGSTTGVGIAGITADNQFCLIGTSGCYSGIIEVNDPTSLYNQTGQGQGYTYESLGGSTNGTADNYDFFAVVEHELDEVLGTASCEGLGNSGTSNNCGGAASAVDQFRYSSAGTRAWTSQSPGGQYFSADGGVTDYQGNLYNTTKSGEDWADFSQGCAFIQDAEACPSTNASTNSYNILNDGPGGTVGPEVAILNAVGYNLQTTNAPEPASISMLGFGLATLGGLAYRRRRQKPESL